MTFTNWKETDATLKWPTCWAPNLGHAL